MYWSNVVNGEGLIIEMGGEDFELTRFNTHLYTFIGHIATRNHLFVITEESDDEVKGVYVWQMFHGEAFRRIVAHVVEHDYPQYLNLNEISDIDERAFQKAVKKDMADIGDFIPEGFLDEA
jgi:hypothetical protein